MPNQSSAFSELIANGEFRVDDSGHASLNGQLLLMMPPPVILKLQNDLAEELGAEEMEEFMYDIGAYQVEQALDRYIERYGLDGISKEKIFDYIESILKVLGWGEIKIEEIDMDENVKITVGRPTLPIVYRNSHDELAEEPICHYLRGLLGAACDAILNEDIEIEETKCAAVGGKECVFEASL